MTTAIIVLALVGALLALSIVRPSCALRRRDPEDRDWERQLAELRALPEYRPGMRLR
jgi:hypothetical protein